MSVKIISGGNRYGTHRVIEPLGVLPQPAQKIDNQMDRIWDNEILVDVDTLNIDSASFAQIKKQSSDNPQQIGETIMDIVTKRGKLQNPVTGSGGMFTGTVSKVGQKIDVKNIKAGDKIASLVSLSLTPLKINRIISINMSSDQVRIEGQAVLFESGIYARMPDDLPSNLALSALDVCGAPAQADKLCKKGDVVVILGATGKSGVLCAYAAKKQVGKEGRVIGIGRSQKKISKFEQLDIFDEIVKEDAVNAVSCHDLIFQLTNGQMADLVINCVNVPDTEMSSILMCRDKGTIYFFSMSTSFTKAALGAEGVGKDVNMIIGNGYTRGHADLTLNILRESSLVRSVFEEHFA
jgi:L-erythro-3,5-diaminohexanoate dehydrogenase